MRLRDDTSLESNPLTSAGHRVLDLDLDFFVLPTEHMKSGRNRLPESRFSCSTPAEVESFLETRCGLRKDHKIPGRLCIDHDEAFDTWREWIETGVIEAPFEVDHVDAHADMGLGDPSWTYLLTDFLALPVEQRSQPKRGSEGLNFGSYLAFAVANRWIRSLAYVYGADTPMVDGFPGDIHTIFFRDENWKHGPIELPHYSHQQIDRILMAVRENPEPLRREPAVRNKYVAGSDYNGGGFTHMILAQSPGYTPASADALISVITQYFYES
jgi:hypothetical protein